MADLFIHLKGDATDFGGVSRVNRQIVESLSRRFSVADDPLSADLQICGFGQETPASLPRLIVDHGSFADAGFWTYTAPRLRCDDTILVSSRVCLEVADRMFGSARPTLVRVPFFADTSVFHPEDDRRSLRAELAGRGQLPADGPIMLTVAAYSRRKNLHLAIRLLHAMTPSAPEVRLVIVGRPASSQLDYARSLRELAEGLGVDDRVHYLDPLPHNDLRDVMCASDLLLHPTTCRMENFGLVVAEALACGLPVLASDWGGLRDLVVDGDSGHLVPTYWTRGGPRLDWLAAVAPAVALVQDGELREAMSRKAVEFARTHLAIPAFAHRLVEAIGTILEQPRRRSGLSELSDRGEDLMFATIQLHRLTKIQRTSEEYRAMLARHEPLLHFLSAPVSSEAGPPRVTLDDRLYPLIPFVVEANALRVTDPAWPARIDLSREELDIAQASDGSRSLSEIGTAIGCDAHDRRTLVESAQALVDHGVLCPRRAVGPA